MEPNRIHALPKDVVNRIAAGEVIQRPCNAIKEMLENSIDARSTKIAVTLNNGGLKLIQIQDDGCGISREDMAIVCERFTTSKISSFDDLKKIATFGFRGEALASITYVAHVKISTKTERSTVGYVCQYSDGKPQDDPKPVAMNRGTTISVEDLFFNVPQRRDAFRSPADEFRRCEAVVSNYAVHFPRIGFSLSKHGENSFAVNTRKNSTVLDNIRTLYGQEIARELLSLEFVDEKISIKATGYVTKANYSNKRRTQLVLFINNRLVECAAIRGCLDVVYQRYLRKDDHPFVYLSLEMPPENVDVNLHPTKSEVGFLHQEYILTRLQEEVDRVLFSCDSSRHYLTKQSVLPAKICDSVTPPRKDELRRDKEVVRVDSSQEKITTLFSQQGAAGSSNEKVEVLLSSIRELSEELAAGTDAELSRNLSRMIYVGFVARDRSLIQIGTQLIMVNHHRLARALFYQNCLDSFANFPAFEFEPLKLESILTLSLKSAKSGLNADMDNASELVEHACKKLLSVSEMLKCYFSIEIEEDGLSRLPVVLDGLRPRIGALPLFLLRLASDINYEDEKTCFRGVCRAIADLYAESCDKDSLRNIVFPAARKKIKVSHKFNEIMVKLTSTEELYKVFERC
ncbi:DNA mismatch repair protein MLH1 [Galendromus occidentalis]|uniref:DNA mismatch repair protein MLH1 n=1 Tax=Galendromus occidentalis TaxID=34638 RepID=A0AAJ6QTS6_9ACAR|nr:DNA mismatch repair protein MLH1 [Galendromus occidentalis]